jgi:hypothetical protein
VGVCGIPVLVGSGINHDSQKAEQWYDSMMHNGDQNKHDVCEELMCFGISLCSKLQI